MFLCHQVLYFHLHSLCSTSSDINFNYSLSNFTSLSLINSLSLCSCTIYILLSLPQSLWESPVLWFCWWSRVLLLTWLIWRRRISEPTACSGTHPSSLWYKCLLLSILPPYITKECLVHLQYFQEIKHIDVGLFPFFPINLFSSFQLRAVWIGLFTPPDSTYTMSWLARCEESHDFFSPYSSFFFFSFEWSSASQLHARSHSTQQASPEDTDYFLLSSDNYLSRDNLFDTRRVQDDCTHFTRHVCSMSLLERSRLEFMHQLTHWYSLFPIDFTSAIPYLCDIVRDTPDLCLYLGFPLCFLKGLSEVYWKQEKRSWLEMDELHF